MLGADGEGGLSLGLEMKQFELQDPPFDTIEKAEQKVGLLKAIQPTCETFIGINPEGKFVIWYRS